MSTISNVVRRIDWPQLRKQKEYLVNLALEHAELDGVVHLLDALQDAALYEGEATKRDIFGDDHG